MFVFFMTVIKYFATRNNKSNLNPMDTILNNALKVNCTDWSCLAKIYFFLILHKVFGELE